jgi:hypothetical protein
MGDIEWDDFATRKVEKFRSCGDGWSREERHGTKIGYAFTLATRVDGIWAMWVWCRGRVWDVDGYGEVEVVGRGFGLVVAIWIEDEWENEGHDGLAVGHGFCL